MTLPLTVRLEQYPDAWKQFLSKDAMTTVVAERESTALALASAPLVTTEQLELIKRTVANGATADELKLYLFDCQRQGVHPLDKLVHFTKRQGKYTPVTSIDFMRIRAAETGEYAGSDDATFETLPGHDTSLPSMATVRVWRLVQGQRCPFTATARWKEYKPDAGASGRGDVMWLKMPHTMLAKCAEALALRKGFPRQLAGLYAKEEMDQAGPVTGGYSVEAPVRDRMADSVDARATTEARGSAPVPGVEVHAGSSPAPVISNYHTTPSPPPQIAPRDPDALYIERVDTSPTKNKNVTKAFVVFSNGEQATTINTQLIGLCQQICQDGDPVTVETKPTKWGTDLVAVHRVASEAIESDFGSAGELSDSDIPF